MSSRVPEPRPDGPERVDGSGLTDTELGPAPGGVGPDAPVLRPDAPVRHLGPPPAAPPVGGPVGAAEPVTRSSTDFVVEPAKFDPIEDRRTERRVSATFLISALATVGFVAAYIAMKIHTPSYGAALNYTLGTTLGIALFALGAGLVMWAKYLLPKEYAVQDRHDGGSGAAARTGMEEDFLAGADRLGIARRPFLRRTMLLAAGILPLPAVVLLRDLGPAPGTQLRRTAWATGKRLVDVETKLPVKLGDMATGGIMTVMPEGFDQLPEDQTATSATILIRLRPGADRPLPGRANWSVDGHVAYSKICTHAGCPTSLYEQQTQNLLCPCHQSTFRVTEGCKVVFGPAARALPQLPIAADPDGYLVAQSDYREPVGPSFWERG